MPEMSDIPRRRWAFALRRPCRDALQATSRMGPGALQTAASLPSVAIQGPGLLQLARRCPASLRTTATRRSISPNVL
jgi:hypothetical protein